MFRCERCGTGFSSKDGRRLEHCPICQEDGVKAPLAFTLFKKDGRSSESLERCRRAARRLGGWQDSVRRSRTSARLDLPAKGGRSPDTLEGKGGGP